MLFHSFECRKQIQTWAQMFNWSYECVLSNYYLWKKREKPSDLRPLLSLVTWPLAKLHMPQSGALFGTAPSAKTQALLSQLNNVFFSPFKTGWPTPSGECLCPRFQLSVSVLTFTLWSNVSTQSISNMFNSNLVIMFLHLQQSTGFRLTPILRFSMTSSSRTEWVCVHSLVYY